MAAQNTVVFRVLVCTLYIALEVSHFMLYINSQITYLLTYLYTVSGGPMYLLTSCTLTIISCDVVAPNGLDAFTLK